MENDFELIDFSQLQEFITKNKINNITKLRKLNNNYYLNYLYYYKSGKSILFNKTFVESAQEYRLVQELVKFGVTNITTGYVFPEFIKNTRPYRFDILLEDYNLFIEVNGKQHFNDEISKNYWKNWRTDTQEDDIIKKDYAESKGFKVMYFTEYSEVYNLYGYFSKVYTNVKDLLNDAKIPIKENINFIKDFEDLSVRNIKEPSREELIDKIQNYITDNKILSPWQLKKKKSVYLNYIYEYKIRDEISFYNQNLKSYNYRNIKSVDDINKIVFENKIVGSRDLRKSKYSGLEEIAKYHKWTIVYYRGADVKIPTVSLTINDINEYLQYHKITNVKDFRNHNDIYYRKSKREKWLDNLVYYKDISDDIS